MKPRNFPESVARRRRRVLLREGWSSARAYQLVPDAREVRTKKNRSTRAKIR